MSSMARAIFATFITMPVGVAMIAASMVAPVGNQNIQQPVIGGVVS